MWSGILFAGEDMHHGPSFYSEEAGHQSFRIPFIGPGRIRMKEVICLSCGAYVELVRFGDGWIGACCGQIQYNSRREPEQDSDADRETTDDAPE